jgi:hypothetical protein
MNNLLIVNIEILFVLVMPLLFLYLKGNWGLRTSIVCMITLPIMWYAIYSPLHELSHVAGTYLAGGKVTYIKLIPSFWRGEFAGAWITTEGLTEQWQWFVMTSFPYILDVLSLIAALFVLRPGLTRRPFVIGLLFMVFSLRPAFDFTCEAIAFISGNRNDFFAVQGHVGSFVIWLLIIFSLLLSVFSIITILKRFAGIPSALPSGAEM